MFIDNTIELDVTILPKLLQNIIKECEEYDNEEDDVLYMGRADALEVFAKHFYAEKIITKKQWKLINRKYCGLE